MGVYISGSGTAYSDFYNLQFHTFLKHGSDRTLGLKPKSEVLIRLGEQLCTELQKIAKMDSVSFINGFAKQATQLKIQTSQDAELRRILQQRIFSSYDYVLLIDSLQLQSRNQKSSYIWSNKIITNEKEVMFAQMKCRLYIRAQSKIIQINTNFDQVKSPKVSISIDIFQKESALGHFFSALFSTYWKEVQLAIGN